MLSEASERYLRRVRRRTVLRRVRIACLLVVLAAVGVWGLSNWLAEHRTFAWDEPVTVAVVALLDEDAKGVTIRESAFIRRFLSTTGADRCSIGGVDAWLRREYRRHTGLDRKILEVSTRGPLLLDRPPPALPGPDASFWERYRGIDGFLDYFEEITQREELLLGQYDATLFIYFYDPSDAERRRIFSSFDSLASRRRGFGIVFAPVKRSLAGSTCAVTAHELCHVLGADDAYRDGSSVYPEGFAEPDRTPLYPQRKAEIMALGRPIAPGVDRPVRDLSECVVGAATARQMNWIEGGGDR